MLPLFRNKLILWALNSRYVTNFTHTHGSYQFTNFFFANFFFSFDFSSFVIRKKIYMCIYIYIYIYYMLYILYVIYIICYIYYIYIIHIILHISYVYMFISRPVIDGLKSINEHTNAFELFWRKPSEMTYIRKVLNPL